MKKKLLSILIIFSIILSFGITFVNAENEENTDVNKALYRIDGEEVTPITDTEEGSADEIIQDGVIDEKQNEDTEYGIMKINEDSDIQDIETVEENVFKADSEITDSKKTVNGNEFLCSNKINIENETINGDLFICGNNVKIKEDVIINGNVFICASNIEIEAKALRDVYIFGQYVSIGENAEIGYSLYSGSEILKVAGTVNRDIEAVANTIEIKDTANILGDFNYSATKEAEFERTLVKGDINFSKQVIKENPNGQLLSDYVISLLKSVIFTLIIFLLILLISPKFANNSKEYMSLKILKSIGIGLASIILIPIVAIFFIMISGTSNFGLLLIPIYIVMFAISMSILTIAIASKLAEKFEKIKLPILVPIVSVVLWLVEQIPYVGSLVMLFGVLAGFGILVQNLFKKKH